MSRRAPELKLGQSPMSMSATRRWKSGGKLFEPQTLEFNKKVLEASREIIGMIIHRQGVNHICGHRKSNLETLFSKKFSICLFLKDIEKSFYEDTQMGLEPHHFFFF